MPISMRECRKRIATLWFGLGGLDFAVMVLYSFGGSLDNKMVQAWGWFLATTMPTISIVASNIVIDAADSSNPNAEEQTVDIFYYRLSMIVSGVYLVTILATLLGWRVTAYQSPYEVMALSSIWIGPMQGVVASIISIFFKKATKGTKRSEQRRSAQGRS